MDREKFEDLVADAIEELPEEFKEKLENVDITVEAFPSRDQLRGYPRGTTLLGLYEGVPHTRRGRSYGLVPPDRITLFQKPIEANCRTEAGVREEIRRVLQHEIAHHFGISDAKLAWMEREKRRKR